MIVVLIHSQFSIYELAVAMEFVDVVICRLIYSSFG